MKLDITTELALQKILEIMEEKENERSNNHANPADHGRPETA